MKLALVIALTACGHASPNVEHDVARDDESGPFVDHGFKPKSFVARVSGEGRPVIFIPGLGCPGEVWDETIAHLSGVQAHVLTLAGFAGRKPVRPPLAATVRRELVRYIRSNHLESPVIVGHSMGGFIAYWVALSAPDLLAGVVVVDAGPALSANDVETARALRNAWAQAGDDELPVQVRTAYSSMTNDPRRIEPFIDAIASSDRQTMGDAIYELVTTDLRAEVAKIQSPLLLVLADGGLQATYRQLVAPVPHHEVVVLPRTRHFVMFDDPAGFAKVLEAFFAKLGSQPSDR